MAIDPDDTIRLRPAPVSGPGQRRQLAVLLGVVLAAGAAALSYLAWPAPRPPAPIAPLPPVAPFAVLDEAAVLELRPDAPTMIRLRENPQIFVLLFPDLEMQADALNRMAALVEKAGLPRDRVVDQSELAAAIARGGETAATWYLGHDYRGADIARFFRLAAAAGSPLSPGEQWLAARFAAAQAAAAPAAEIALISLPNPDRRLDAAARAAILRHEIGHGHFFTRPALAARVQAVWATRFGDEARAAFVEFLGREGYDTANSELMANEAMAYLVFTPDPRLFAARHVGLPEAEVERLRSLMQEAVTPP